MNPEYSGPLRPAVFVSGRENEKTLQKGVDLSLIHISPFYQQLRAIAIPVAVQNLITVGVSMLDTLMLGSMGEVQLSASSLANQWFFMLKMCIRDSSKAE